MSCKILKESLTRSQLLEIKNDLFVEGIESDYGPAETIDAWGETVNSLYIPHNYANKYFGQSQNKHEFPKTKFEFLYDFKNELQKEVYKEAVEFLNKNGSCFLSLFTNFGKCMGINTPVLMFDGTIKMVQDIKVGDLIMGDDSTPRNVLSLARGKEMMYKVVPTKGEPYIVNESHILSLKITANNVVYPYNRKGVQIGYLARYLNRETYKIATKIFYFKDCKSPEIAYERAKRFVDLQDQSNIVDIPLKDYYRIYSDKRSFLCGYKVPIDFSEKPVELDPYILGAWLGDGHSHAPYITNIDEELLNYLREKLPEYDCYLKQTKDPIIYLMKSNNQQCNKIIRILKKYNLIQNKHIPHVYKCNSRKIRLAVLAGLIDTDGYFKTNCYEIIQKSKRLAEDITFLARSLGYACYMKECKKTCTNSKNGPKTGTYYRMILSGSFEELPILISRKKGGKRIRNKDHLVTGIKIEPLQVDDYYGFAIDGNHRFVLGDFTVTHNTFLGIKLSYKTKLKTAIFIHRKILADQWVESITKFTTAKVQVMGTGDSLDPDADYYIFNIAYVPKVWDSDKKQWSQKKLGKEYSSIGTLIVDEAHIACASEMCKALLYFQPRYAIALTATPKRADGLDKLLDLYFGEEKIIRISQNPFIVYRFSTKIKPEYTKNARGKKDWNSVVEYLVKCEKRNKMIVDVTQKFPHKTIMIMSKRVDHCKIIGDLLKKAGESVTIMKGTDKDYDKTARILVSTFSKLGVGFDDQRLDLLILTCSVKEVEQYAGRLRHSEGKERVIIDMVDDDCNCQSHWLTRRKWYLSRNGEIKKYPFEIEDDSTKEEEPVVRKRFAPKI